MNHFGATQFDGAVTLTLAASSAQHPVRLGELNVLLSGTSPLGHTHLLSSLTDWSNLGPYASAVLSQTPTLRWMLVGGLISGAVRLKPGGGLVETASGLMVLLSGTAASPTHTHLLSEITDFNAQLPGRVFVILSGTNTVGWTSSGGTIAGAVRRKAAGGLQEDANGLYVDLGTASTQAARGDHTHGQLHDPVTLLSGSATLDVSLTGQQLGGEVKLDPAGGLTVLLSGVGANFGTGATQIARGNHTHAQLHDEATVISTPALALGISATQVLSGAVRVDLSPASGRGRVGIGVSGLFVHLGGTADTAAAGNHVHTSATPETDGFMSAADKYKLDALTSGAVFFVPQQLAFTRESPTVQGNALLGYYVLENNASARWARASALCGTVNTTLELEVAGVLTGQQIVLLSGTAGQRTTAVKSLAGLTILSGAALRWVATGGALLSGAAHREIGLSLGVETRFITR